MKTLYLDTHNRTDMCDITREVQNAVAASGMSAGICHVHCAHTTAAITLNENADPTVTRDILLSLDDAIRELSAFRHAEGNSTAHVKASLVGNSITLPVQNGALVLGTWQGIYFCEFDGPRRQRTVWVTCTPEYH